MEPGDFLSGKYRLSDLTRNQRRLWRKENAKQPKVLTEVPRSQWPTVKNKLIRVWASRDYLVQAFDEGASTRLSVSRTEIQANGRWKDKISWEELQQIKHDCGYGDAYAIEIYPRNKDIVNVANMRHLWILPEPLEIGWFK